MTTTRYSKLRTASLAVALIVVLALVSASVASAQSWAGKGRVQGKIKGPDGNNLEGVKVTLAYQGVEGQGPEPLMTNKKGHWSYLGLTGGSWSVVLEYDGMMPGETSIRVSEFGANPPLNYQMKPVPRDLEQEAADHRRQLLDQGNDYLAAGKTTEARAAYEEVMGELEEQQHPVLLRAIARTHYEEKNLDKAIAALDKALALAPDDTDSLQLAINLLVADGREGEAQAYMDRLPEGSKVDANAVLNMGIKAYNDNDIEGALKHFDRAAVDNPDSPDVYYYRGLAHLNSSNSEQALADFAKVLELAPSYAKADEVKQFVEYLESQ